MGTATRQICQVNRIGTRLMSEVAEAESEVDQGVQKMEKSKFFHILLLAT